MEPSSATCRIVDGKAEVWICKLPAKDVTMTQNDFAMAALILVPSGSRRSFAARWFCVTPRFCARR
jgi:hypothetical protein